MVSPLSLKTDENVQRTKCDHRMEIYYLRSEIIINSNSSIQLWFISTINTIWQKFKKILIVIVFECPDDRYKIPINDMIGYEKKGKTIYVNFS